jgi:hypothetical protein
VLAGEGQDGVDIGVGVLAVDDGQRAGDDAEGVAEGDADAAVPDVESQGAGDG